MELILRYFPGITEHQKHQFSQLGQLYRFWNSQINLISRKDIDHLYERHVLHSLAIARFFKFNPSTTILDVGTGGGFPGIPLAIFFPSVNFTLIDSIGKKISAVNEIIKSLELNNVSACNTRVENVKEKYDFIISRAVTEFIKFIKLTKGNIQPLQSNTFANGIIYLKGGDFEKEVKSVKDKIIIHNIFEAFHEIFFETKKIIYYPFEK
jgi:16S rRNA (guanine527-N7)-methyltransferase